MMLKKALARQEGLSMLMVLVFMGLAVPLVTAAFSLSGGLSSDSRIKTDILKRQYSGLGGSEYAQYVVEDDQPPGDYPVTLNGETVNVSVASLPPILPPPPPADNSRRFQTSLVVTPTTASVSVLTTFTYTVTVTNRDDEPENLNKIDAVMPPDFSYVSGSTTGITSLDPSVSGQQLSWSLSETLQPEDAVSVSFDAQATLAQGNYCGEAWATSGGPKTGTGLTARIAVGSPATDLCPGEATTVTKTVEVAAGSTLGSDPITLTYTITVENTGDEELSLKRVQDLLPEGFLYVPGSDGGEFFGLTPSQSMSGDREKLVWSFSPKLRIDPGETKTMSFDAQGVFDGGHWNEAWLQFDDFPHDVYTWPTAEVEVISIAETTATTDDGTTVYSQIWKIDDGSYLIWEWEIQS